MSTQDVILIIIGAAVAAMAYFIVTSDSAPVRLLGTWWDQMKTGFVFVVRHPRRALRTLGELLGWA